MDKQDVETTMLGKKFTKQDIFIDQIITNPSKSCLLYTSPSPRD